MVSARAVAAATPPLLLLVQLRELGLDPVGVFVVAQRHGDLGEAALEVAEVLLHLPAVAEAGKHLVQPGRGVGRQGVADLADGGEHVGRVVAVLERLDLRQHRLQQRLEAGRIFCVKLAVTGSQLPQLGQFRLDRPTRLAGGDSGATSGGRVQLLGEAAQHVRRPPLVRRRVGREPPHRLPLSQRQLHALRQPLGPLAVLLEQRDRPVHPLRQADTAIPLRLDRRRQRRQRPGHVRPAVHRRQDPLQPRLDLLPLGRQPLVDPLHPPLMLQQHRHVQPQQHRRRPRKNQSLKSCPPRPHPPSRRDRHAAFSPRPNQNPRPRPRNHRHRPRKYRRLIQPRRCT